MVYVAHAPRRAVSRLISTPFRSGDTNVDAARLGACATKGLMSILREGLTINE
jgi:hypothetical protein